MNASPASPKDGRYEVIPIEYLQLSTRPHRHLKRAGVCTVADLIQLTPEDILRIPNLGRTSLNEILFRLKKHFGASLEELRVRSGLPSRRDAEAQGTWLGDSDLILASDHASVSSLVLPARAKAALRRLKISTIAELAATPPPVFLRLRNVGETSISAVRRALRRYIIGRNQSPPLLPQGLALKGLADQLLARLASRSRRAVMDWFGLWDGVGETLQDIADKMGLSRSRVGQILSRARTELREMLHSEPSFKGAQCVIFAEVLLPSLAKGSGLVTSEETKNIVCGQEPSVSPERTAYDFLSQLNGGEPPVLKDHLVRVDEGVYAVSRSTAEFYQAVVSCAEDALGRTGGPLHHQELAKQTIAEALPLRAVSLLSFAVDCLRITPKLTRDESGLVGLPSWDFFPADTLAERLETALAKIGRPVHYTQLTLLLDELFPSRAPFASQNVLARLGTDPHRFVWSGPGVYGLRRWSLSRAPTIKERLTEVLDGSGRPLPLERLKSLVLQTCMCKESSVKAILTMNESTFVLVDEGVYGLACWYPEE